MRINLLLDDAGGARPGWVNIDPAAPQGCKDRVAADPANLAPFADRGEVTELEAGDLLDYLPLARAKEVFSHWASLLARGGVLVAYSTDPYELAKSLASRLIDHAAYSEVLFGRQARAWECKQSCLGVAGLVALAEGAGLEVLKKRVTGHHGLVVARRPL